MQSAQNTAAAARVPFEVWTKVLSYADVGPVSLLHLKAAFAAGNRPAQSPLAQLGMAAQDDRLMQPFIEPEELQKFRAEVAAHDAGKVPPPESLFHLYEQRFKKLPLDVRREMAAAYAGRALPISDTKISEYIYAAALLSPSQRGEGHHIVKRFSENLKNNKDLALVALDNDGRSYETFSLEIKRDEDVACRALARWPWVAKSEYFEERILRSFERGKRIFSNAIRQNKVLLAFWAPPFEDLPDDLQMPENAELLSFAKSLWLTSRPGPPNFIELQNLDSEDKVLVFVTINPGALKEAVFPRPYIQDKTFVLRLFESLPARMGWRAVAQENFLDPSMIEDKEMVLFAHRYGIMHNYSATSSLNNNLDIALSYFSRANFSRHYDSFLGFLETDVYLSRLSDRVRNNRRVWLAYLRAKPRHFKNLQAHQQRDEEALSIVLPQSRLYLWDLVPDLLLDRDFLRKILEKYPDGLQWLLPYWQRDREMVATVARQRANTLLFADKTLRSDEDFVVSLMRKNDFSHNFSLIYHADVRLGRNAYRILKRGNGISKRRAEIAVYQQALTSAFLSIKTSCSHLISPLDLHVKYVDGRQETIPTRRGDIAAVTSPLWKWRNTIKHTETCASQERGACVCNPPDKLWSKYR